MEVGELRIPDRFERLRDLDAGTLGAIVVPVESMLAVIDERFMDMHAADRGSFMILRGQTGAGKSTFLDTVSFFRVDVETQRISQSQGLASGIPLGPVSHPRIVVLEGREALGQVSRQEIEATMHAVNQFIRSEAGCTSLVVWPTNTDDLTSLLKELGNNLGGEALFGLTGPITMFEGPAKADYVRIAQQTVATLNDGASLDALGVSLEHAEKLVGESETIGSYLARIRKASVQAGDRVRRLLVKERYRLWTVVVAGNEPEGDVAALTRGGQAYADIDRLVNSTGANIVNELKQHPEMLGILGTVLDARIVHLDMVCINAIARTFGTSSLHAAMQGQGMQISADSSAVRRIQESDLGTLLQGMPLRTRKRGPKPGQNTKDAFVKLAEISRTSDGLLNEAVGRALVAAGLVEQFKIEHPLGADLSFFSDIYCIKEGAPIRLEFMWRTRTGRATIANYVLGKLNNYGKAIGLMN
ncbi:hypothetical protein [Nonomuraea jabiensis]|uniref:DNA (Cytosine-5)-methyltransferase 1 n=1 Tax=Nonomuraea jabiensis TaxID=882448 RepID=A0A7W9GI48_9ACTN|nr:hypothetical protein [Nonomuraea jabiensis]MBB5784262.1 DNA (cytosine-5)-methyltransferase 1 [Nonomuraea jabiensis]